jgi:hypothetical protein
MTMQQLLPAPGSGAEAATTRPDERANPPALATLGHNGGPPLEDDDPAGWRLWCWRRARRRAWSAPREIALSRLARAETLGLTYREYTLEILERGRYL